ncbi:MAG: glycerol-3-phosphate 1-O-acyltransferase PlsY [Acutalibacteraceae bacterium]|nr:glycerol-3-phosphate 1-O-acyltransferase PlsY [Acutalibacteraceae bacterium]
MIAFAVLAPVLAYLIGSISFAVIFTKCFSKTDVREHGSGNAGTTNVLRVAGKTAGLLTFLCDALKGAVAALIGMLIFKAVFGSDASTFIMYGKYICGISCMMGHAFPIWFGFKGGKCAATSVGIFAVCCPFAIVAGLIGYAVNMLVTGIVSLSTLIATVLVVGFSIGINGFDGIQNPDFVVIGLSLLGGIIVFWRHKDNIKRLIKGEEKKLKIKK